jgi:hypothetical protein
MYVGERAPGEVDVPRAVEIGPRGAIHRPAAAIVADVHGARAVGPASVDPHPPRDEVAVRLETVVEPVGLGEERGDAALGPEPGLVEVDPGAVGPRGRLDRPEEHPRPGDHAGESSPCVYSGGPGPIA